MNARRTAYLNEGALRRVYWYSTIFLALTCCAVVIGYASSQKDSIYQELKLYAKVKKLVQLRYVDEIDKTILDWGGVLGIIRKLDPYNALIRADEESGEEPGSTRVFGMDLGYGKDGFISVVTVIPGSPASEGGLYPGDVLYRINERPLDSNDLYELIRSIRSVREELGIKVIRGMQMKELAITPGKETAAKMKSALLKDGIGYFRPTTPWKKAFAKRASRKIKSLHAENGLILDFRGLSGGDWEEGMELAGLFLPEKSNLGVLELRTEKGKETKEFFADREGAWSKLPLAVLIGRGTSDAAEVCAGILKDDKRAKLFGVTTYGRVLHQQRFPLVNGAELILTVGSYMRPGGEAVKGIGVEPDEEREMPLTEEVPYPVPGPSDEVVEIARQFLSEK